MELLLVLTKRTYLGVAGLKSSSKHVFVSDVALLMRYKNGDIAAYEILHRRYYTFIRLKAKAYFLPGGENGDLIQEGVIGFMKACRDFRLDRDSSFRSFAELCITRNIITAVKGANRKKHRPLNTFMSFSLTVSESDSTSYGMLEEVYAGSRLYEPDVQVISSQELHALVGCLSTALSELESRVIALFLDNCTYEEIGEKVGVGAKTVDNALQRVKRKVDAHLKARAV